MATDAENPGAEERGFGPEPGPVPGPGPGASPAVDRPSLALGLIASAFLAGAAWLWLGPGFWPAPPKVGAPPPPARFERLAGGGGPEQRMVLGIEGRVTWLVFLSAESPDGRAVLPRLESSWRRLRSSGRFAMVAAAVDQPGPERLRAALSGFEGEGRLPLYRADGEARRVFGVDRAEPPWHFLIDPQGRIAAVARGAGSEMIDRLARQARRWLDAMDPLDARFLAARTDVVARPGRR